MARRVYVSFQPDRDLWRAHRVRGAAPLRDFDVVGFFEPIEPAALRDDPARAGRIAARLEGTTVTVVLIGKQTAGSDWVAHEVALSVARGNALVGLRIHHVPDQHGDADWFPGPTPRVPDGVAWPVFDWDPDLVRLRREIESAGRRADAPWRDR